MKRSYSHRSEPTAGAIWAGHGFIDCGRPSNANCETQPSASKTTSRWKGAVQAPIFLALLAAAGIAIGGWRAMREETDDDSGHGGD